MIVAVSGWLPYAATALGSTGQRKSPGRESMGFSFSSNGTGKLHPERAIDVHHARGHPHGRRIIPVRVLHALKLLGQQVEARRHFSMIRCLDPSDERFTLLGRAKAVDRDRSARRAHVHAAGGVQGLLSVRLMHVRSPRPRKNAAHRMCHTPAPRSTRFAFEASDASRRHTSIVII